ncbi:MAG TPA: UdgX family uracil-DNA binding protein [Usitatibacter sp.]|nr:UdgX family uracil-DNA binding protein [Usitatibacter sp.]
MRRRRRRRAVRQCRHRCACEAPAAAGHAAAFPLSSLVGRIASGRGNPPRGAHVTYSMHPAARRRCEVRHLAKKLSKAAAAAQLEALRKRAAGCRDCPLWENATQTVFGEGDARAPIMIVGEQPGDVEDREGHPFVGPAGRILTQGLDEAGIDRRHVYITNAVKHFKWEPRGKRRLHKSPAQREIEACYQWLESEMQAVQPKLVVALGATAAKVLLGPRFRITQGRGEVQRREGLPDVIATYHPSFLLRIKTRPEGDEAYGQFVDDLRAASRYLQD